MEDLQTVLFTGEHPLPSHCSLGAVFLRDMANLHWAGENEGKLGTVYQRVQIQPQDSSVKGMCIYSNPVRPLDLIMKGVRRLAMHR